MSHPSQQNFVKSCQEKYPQYFHNNRVLEVGSLNINGTVRDFFTSCEYIGIDVAPGANVDLVCQGQDYRSDCVFDTTISCECLEHNPYWLETFQNMINLVRSQGMVIMTCATTGRQEHGTPRTTPNDSPLTTSLGWTYYRNLTEQDFTQFIDFDQVFDVYEFRVQGLDLFFWGIKK